MGVLAAKILPASGEARVAASSMAAYRHCAASAASSGISTPAMYTGSVAAAIRPLEPCAKRGVSECHAVLLRRCRRPTLVERLGRLGKEGVPVRPQAAFQPRRAHVVGGALHQSHQQIF